MARLLKNRARRRINAEKRSIEEGKIETRKIGNLKDIVEEAAYAFSEKTDISYREALKRINVHIFGDFNTLISEYLTGLPHERMGDVEVHSADTSYPHIIKRNGKTVIVIPQKYLEKAGHVVPKAAKAIKFMNTARYATIRVLTSPLTHLGATVWLAYDDHKIAPFLTLFLATAMLSKGKDIRKKLNLERNITKIKYLQELSEEFRKNENLRVVPALMLARKVNPQVGVGLDTLVIEKL